MQSTGINIHIHVHTCMRISLLFNFFAVCPPFLLLIQCYSDIQDQDPNLTIRKQDRCMLLAGECWGSNAPTFGLKTWTLAQLTQRYLPVCIKNFEYAHFLCFSNSTSRKLFVGNMEQKCMLKQSGLQRIRNNLNNQ